MRSRRRFRRTPTTINRACRHRDALAELTQRKRICRVFPMRQIRLRFLPFAGKYGLERRERQPVVVWGGAKRDVTDTGFCATSCVNQQLPR